jgi:hypothetical protein
MGKYLDLAEGVVATRQDPRAAEFAGPEPGMERLALAQYPADELGEPCVVCGSKEKWVWLDGRRLCRPCLIRGGDAGERGQENAF